MRQHFCLGSILLSVACVACGGGGDEPAAMSGTSASVATPPWAGRGAPGNGLGSAGMAGAFGAAVAGAEAGVQGPTAGVGASRADGFAGATASVGMGGTGGIGEGGAGGAVGPAGSAAGAGASGSGASAPSMTLDDCPAPPPGAGDAAVAALNAVNALRVAAGAPCAALDLQIVQAASAHCSYFQTNNSSDPMCTSNPHMEVMGCAGFTGESPVDRMRAAGFTGFGGGEVMAFVNNPERAVQTWVDSVWHRLPILDPSTNLLGYGSTGSPGNCDTIDFGPGNRVSADTTLVYPYDGQTGVTTTFDGSREGPMPPAPPTGWPSANPITLYAQKPMITEHVLTVDGSAEPIEHVWLDANSDLLSASDKQFLRSAVFMYANTPFMPNTKYRVKMSGSYAGGALMREWTFTTGAAPTWPRR